MTELKILERAINIAVEAHTCQYDKSGNPYILHPMRVMLAGQTINEQICGVLHDVVEDSSFTIENLREVGIPENIIEALKCLTKISKDEDYDSFIERVKTNPLAIRVKLNDLKDNLDASRLKELKDKDIKRLEKYIKAYNELKKIAD